MIAKRLVLRAAVRVDERARGRAEPRAPDRIAHEAHDRVFELALGADLHRRVVGQERLGNLGEVLHVRPEDDRLAEDRRLEDVVAARAARGCRRRRRPWRSDRPGQARRSCRG